MIADLEERGEVAVTFVMPGVPNDAIEIKGVRRDVAYVQIEEGDDEGTLIKVPYGKLRPR